MLFSLPVPPTAGVSKVTSTSQFPTLGRKPGNMQRKLRFSHKSSAPSHKELVTLRVRSQGLAARSHPLKAHGMACWRMFSYPITSLLLALAHQALSEDVLRLDGVVKKPGYIMKHAIENHDFDLVSKCLRRASCSTPFSAHSSPLAASKGTSWFQEELAVTSQA